MTSPTYSRGVDLMEAEIGDELVALAPDAGECFGFNEVAATVWRSLAKPKSFDQLRQELLDDYEVAAEQCTSELRELLDNMVERGLLRQA